MLPNPLKSRVTSTKKSASAQTDKTGAKAPSSTKVFFSRRLPSANKVLRLISAPGEGIFGGSALGDGGPTFGGPNLGGPHCGEDATANTAADPAGSGPAQAKAFVICDKKLKKLPALKNWLADRRLVFYFAEGGESFKSIEQAPLHFQAILRLAEEHSMRAGGRPGFISLGGGSISDFTGFAASVYQRGAPLIHVPSTWLAAIDSAHGGKSALNVSGAKNAIGSFHFPKAVFIAEELLDSQPLERKTEALGELMKTALIAGGGFYKNLCADWPLFFKTASEDAPRRSAGRSASSRGRLTEKGRDLAKTAGFKNNFPQKFLRQAVAFKTKTVRQDPFERGSLRRKLNLGHTAGHVIEAACGLPHGSAVVEGLLFSARWSARKKFLNRKRLQEIKTLLSPLRADGGEAGGGRQIPRVLFQNLLRKDKKYRSPACLDFIFLKGPGAVFVQNVRERDLMQEAERQGLTTKAHGKNLY